MQRPTLWALLLFGLGLVFCGVVLLSVDTPALAQDATDEAPAPMSVEGEEVRDLSLDLAGATEVGVRECVMCHRPVLRDHSTTRHAMTLRDVTRINNAVLADFSDGSDVRTVLLPGETNPRPFDVSDIAYAVGTGKNVQRYLYSMGSDAYIVLPAQWNVNTQAWEPYGTTEEWPSDAYAFGPNCAGCHTTDFHVEEFIWEEDGVQCEACHGPGSLHVEAVGSNADLATIRATIVMSPDPQICGQCHSQGTAPQSNLPFPVDYQPGVTDLLSDDVFTLVPPDDEAHWYPSGHAEQKYMQFNEALVSAHASALTDMLASESADESCLECHSGDYRWAEDLLALHESGERVGIRPARISMETAQFGVTCANCHDPHGTTSQPAMARTDTYTMCTRCHVNPSDADYVHFPAREMFEGISQVANVQASPSAHFTAEDGPRCVTCHMPDTPVAQAGVRDSHRWTPILPGTSEELQDSCTTCHSEFADVDGMIQIVDGIRNGTRGRLEAAKALLTDSQPEWVAQTLAFVENDGSEGIHNYAYTNALLSAAELELGIVPVAATDPDLSAFGGAPEPADVQLEREPFIPQTFGGGLTLPSILLLAIGGATIGIAGYFFFLRQR